MKIFHLAFKCILIIWSHVRGLDSSVNIMDHVLTTDMLVIEVNIVISMVNGFMYKYMHRQQAIIVWVNYTVLKCISFVRLLRMLFSCTNIICNN